MLSPEGRAGRKIRALVSVLPRRNGHICQLRHILSEVDGERPVVWFAGEVRTPPFSREARIEAGVLLRQLPLGVSLGMPHSRPMRAIGKRCHELRVPDREASWRILFRLDPDAVVILEVFAKKTAATPKAVIETCRRRLRAYDARLQGGSKP